MAQFWGAVPGRGYANVSKWQRLELGDAVFFYGEKRLYLAGHPALGWSDNAFVQGFTVVDGDKADKLAELVNLDVLTIPTTQSAQASGTTRSTSAPDWLEEGSPTIQYMVAANEILNGYQFDDAFEGSRNA